MNESVLLSPPFKQGFNVLCALSFQGKSTSDAGDKVLKEQLVNLKRENNELNTKIKQMDAEIKRGAKQATTIGNEEVRSVSWNSNP